MFQQKGAGYVLKPLFACKAALRAGVAMMQQNIRHEMDIMPVAALRFLASSAD